MWQRRRSNTASVIAVTDCSLRPGQGVVVDEGRAGPARNRRSDDDDLEAQPDLGAVLASAITGQAQAQFMDMSGMIMSNLMFDQMMQQQAAAAAQQWYDNVQAYRRATGDYTTPALSGFNAQTLSAANQAISQAYDAYNQS
jgi:hypothetical protein